MPSIFKYSERVWSDLLLEEGGVRIGTLFDYRRSEHKAGISDSVEGKKTVSHDINAYSTKGRSGIDHESIKSLAPFKIPPSADISLRNVRFTKEFNARDCFIHCTSFALSRNVLEQFGSADSCVEIHKPAAFYRHITAIINRITPVHFYGYRKVVYGDRNEKFNGEGLGLRPDLIKGLEFSAQCEVRAIWLPKSRKVIKPFNLKDRSLIKFCRHAELE
ncbi:hypothetical protein NPS29_12490 [Pseudomonas putida]|uniref:hypothetical protein n=1 Tax=Pseudomonas putida TaxID=303 RepID=UPI00236481FB|nr:hypothetical protein [Pseudomonas putida]MDD1966139.1 hypothetical protein [Pseudomonas putida]